MNMKAIQAILICLLRRIPQSRATRVRGADRTNGNDVELLAEVDDHATAMLKAKRKNFFGQQKQQWLLCDGDTDDDEDGDDDDESVRQSLLRNEAIFVSNDSHQRFQSVLKYDYKRDLRTPKKLESDKNQDDSVMLAAGAKSQPIGEHLENLSINDRSFLPIPAAETEGGRQIAISSHGGTMAPTQEQTVNTNPLSRLKGDATVEDFYDFELTRERELEEDAIPTVAPTIREAAPVFAGFQPTNDPTLNLVPPTTAPSVNRNFDELMKKIVKKKIVRGILDRLFDRE